MSKEDMKKDDEDIKNKVEEMSADEDDAKDGEDEGIDTKKVKEKVLEGEDKDAEGKDDVEEGDDKDADDKEDDKKDDEDDKDVEEQVSYAEVATASVATITEGMEDLSEDFKTKAETIMEAAIAAEAKTIRESVEAEFEEKFTKLEEQLSANADEYFEYVVREWIEENKIEVEKGLRVTLAENFMTDFVGLLKEHNVMVPEDKLDLFEKVEEEKAGLETKVNDLTEQLLESKKEIFEHKKAETVKSLAEGLADTQVEKFESLVEGLEAKDIETFETKAKTIRESAFDKKTDEKDEKLTESVDTKAEPAKGMDKYIASARRYNDSK